MSQLDALKAAVGGIPDMILAAPTLQVTEAWGQAHASFASLMTGSNNPRIERISAYMTESREIAFYFEGRETALREMIEELVASM
jgi:phage regulator Rha-like protein